jgi:hypothetical protein
LFKNSDRTVAKSQGTFLQFVTQIHFNSQQDSHEQRRKKVKAVLGEKNTNYITYRTRDIVKLQKPYFNKCVEYANLQQQILISSHEDTNDSHYLSPIMARISSDEPRISNDSVRGDIDTHSIVSQDNSASSPPYSINKKNSMAGFITQMRSQLANAAATDPSKQTARLAKVKKEIHDAGKKKKKIKKSLCIFLFVTTRSGIQTRY